MEVAVGVEPAVAAAEVMDERMLSGVATARCADGPRRG